MKPLSPSKPTVLIVDDERLARQELRHLLKLHQELEIVGESHNGIDAVSQIQELRPDAVFLDIEMPGMNGLEVVKSLDLPLPWIIFITAFNQHAIEAFEVNALDFIVKPIDPQRLTASVERLLKQWQQKSLSAVDGANDALKENSKDAPLTENDRIFLQEGERCWFVTICDIHLLESEGNYTKVYFEKGSASLPKSLSELGERLPKRQFFRANRSQIINTHAIEEVIPWFSHSLKARLTIGKEVEFSRRASQLFRAQASL